MADTSLPTEQQLRDARFPATVEYAAQIFTNAARSSSATVPLASPHLPLLRTLMATSHGSRGLFVALLSQDDVPFADAEPVDDGLIAAFIAAGDADGDGGEGKASHAAYVRSLIVKNVVMPAAMVVRYDAMQEPDQRAGSEMTCRRATRVLAAWHAAEKQVHDNGEDEDEGVREVARDMRDSLTGLGGPFDDFVRKWGYGRDECEAMVRALRVALGNALD